MANAAAGTVWNLPNYVGELFTADAVNTPFLSMIGGLTGGLQATQFEYATDAEYSHEALSQKSITETDSLTAPAAISYVREQHTNVIQIFHEAVSLSYSRLSNQGRMSGLNSAGAVNPVGSERDFQISKALEAIARQIEWHMLQGTYNLSAAANQANQMRGMIALCAGKNTVAAGTTALSDTLMSQLLLEMHTNGAVFKNMVIFCGGFQKKALSDIYGYAPEDRNVGGVNIKQIETDYGNIGVANPHRLMPAGTLLIADMSVISPVFLPVPEKGNLFYEPLAKTGASEQGQIYGQVGLSYGPDFYHGTLTGLTTS